MTCNLRCRFCTVWRTTPARTIDLATVQSSLSQLAARGLRKVHFSGGEVLLLDWFPDAVRSASALGLQVNLTTNGTLLDRDLARFLVDERVHSVTVSIDAADAGRHDDMRGVKGAWQRAWRGIARLADRKRRKGRGPVIAVNTVVTRTNIGDLQALYMQLRQGGVDRWRLLPVDTDDRKLRPTAPQWEALARQWDAWRDLLTRLPVDWSSSRSAERARKGKYAGVFYGANRCFAPWFNVFIGADGTAYPCCMGKRHMPGYGNVLDTPIDALLSSEARRRICYSFAAGHQFPICDCCDDFLDENASFARLRDDNNGKGSDACPLETTEVPY
jgi:MoaA/NifB/PqqE/SkfB family radical SAM enzyme